MDIQRLIEAARPVLLARIRARIGDRLARALDAEDVFQESLAAAIRSCGRAWSDGRAGFQRYLMGIAELRIRHEARRQRVRGSLPLDEQVVPRSERPHRTERADSLGRISNRAVGLQPTHRWVVFLRDWMDPPWGTVEFPMARPSPSPVQGLHHRARTALGRHLGRETH